uniref:Uncharacterized protein n=1 Tax=Anopheles epiroticus TaxID=199890 RepID=A0A182P7C4_9DIPT
MQNDREDSSPHGEESIYEQTRKIINNLPVNPTVYDGTYPAYENFTTSLVLDSSVSELSFSSESPDSDSQVHFQPVEPIVELPTTPLKDGSRPPEEFKKNPSPEPMSPSKIGAALEKSGTVLMQRSLENRLAQQLEQMHTLMSNDDELVVLKQPSIRAMASQPAFTREMLRDFMEHSETMFNLVHETSGTNGNSAQFVIGIEETEGSDAVAPGCSHRPVRRSMAPFITDDKGESEFVGCFCKDDDMVLYKRKVPEEANPDRSNGRESIDSLIARHAECLVEADKVTSPTVHVRQVNNNNVLALLTFSDQSSAILKTNSAMTEGITSEEELNRTLLTAYRKLVSKPDEMISMQTQSSINQKPPLPEVATHKHNPRSSVMNNLSNATSSFGLSNDSQLPMVVQGSSKNWTSCPRVQHAAEIVLNLRLLLEEYILRNISVTGTVLKFVRHVLSEVLCRLRHEVGKIKHVLNELLVPHSLEDPVRIVNQLRHTIEEIQNYPLKVRVLSGADEAWTCVLRTLEKLVCELDHDIDQPELFIEGLQYGVRCVSDACTASDAAKDKKVVSIDSAVVDADAKVFPTSSSVLEIDRYEAPSVSFCKPYTCFFERIVHTIWSVLVWIMNQMNSFWDFLNSPPPPLLSDRSPSVSFHPDVLREENIAQHHRDESFRLNQARNVLRIALEKSSQEENAPATSETTDRSVNARSLEMFTQLLHDAGSIELRHSSSRNIHLQLHASISGMLEKREADDYVTMAGNIRDHDANVAVFFDARIIDLESLAKVESVMECVTHIGRLSDDVENSEILSDETIVHQVGGTEQHDGEEQVASSLIEDEVCADERYGEPFPAISTTEAEQFLTEIKCCLQDLLAPVTTEVQKMCDQFYRGIVERSSTMQEDASEHYTVEVTEPAPNEEEIRDNAYQIEPVAVDSQPPRMSSEASHLQESIQELLALFNVTNERLKLINSDVDAIRNEVQQLTSAQQQQQQQLVPEGTPIAQTEMRRSTQRKSITKKRQKTYEVPIVRCPVQQHTLPFGQQNGAYCPTEICSCNPVAPDVLIVHWRVLDDDVLHCVGGFEIYVDNELRSVCYSNKRRTALIQGVDLKKQHQIALRVTSAADQGSACTKTAQWAPAFFLYHT